MNNIIFLMSPCLTGVSLLKGLYSGIVLVKMTDIGLSVSVMMIV